MEMRWAEQKTQKQRSQRSLFSRWTSSNCCGIAPKHIKLLITMAHSFLKPSACFQELSWTLSWDTHLPLTSGFMQALAPAQLETKHSCCYRLPASEDWWQQRSKRVEGEKRIQDTKSIHPKSRDQSYSSWRSQSQQSWVSLGQVSRAAS